MDDNWIVENLEGAFATWNSKLTEIWSLVSETPQHFKNGAIWAVCQNINTALQAISYGLLILFFAYIAIFPQHSEFSGLPQTRTGIGGTLSASWRQKPP